MSNSITISVEFDFKGVNFRPSLKIDLERETIKADSMDYLRVLLARYNKIDLYSYEYEIMQASPIKFSEPIGIVSAFVKDGELDFEGFILAQKRADIIKSIQMLIHANPDSHLLKKQLEETPEMIEVLIDIYRLGQDQVMAETS